MSGGKSKGAARDARRSEPSSHRAVPAGVTPPVVTVTPPSAESPPPAAKSPEPTPAAAPAGEPAVTVAPTPSIAVPESPQIGATPSTPPAADDAWTVLAEAQAAFARGFAEIATAVGGMTRSGIAASADLAVALLGARTFAEAVEINAGMARRGIDAILEGSTRLSEIGVKTATEASRPILSRFGGIRSGAGRD